jgi:hypothetical protein
LSAKVEHAEHADDKGRQDDKVAQQGEDSQLSVPAQRTDECRQRGAQPLAQGGQNAEQDAKGDDGVQDTNGFG